MLDALKFAFEILIVGALALPWVAVLYHTFPEDRPTHLKFNLSFIPEGAQSAVSLAVVLAFGYLIGSAVSRFSRDFFNDELLQPLPTEDVIRDSVYYEELCSNHWIVYTKLSKPIHLEAPTDFCDFSSSKKDRKLTDLTPEQREQFDEKVQELFLLEDSELLLQGVDKIDRLKQYFDQITILRGAAFNGFVLFSLALLGSFGQLKDRWFGHRVLRLLTFLPPVIAAIWVLLNLWRHRGDHIYNVYSDPPLAELAILLLATAGFFMIWKPSNVLPYFRICIMAAVLTVVSFGGWWWTEVMYDLQVIHSLTEVNYKGETNPLVGQPLIMKRGSPSQQGPPPPTPPSSTPAPNQKP